MFGSKMKTVKFASALVFFVGYTSLIAVLGTSIATAKCIAKLIETKNG